MGWLDKAKSAAAGAKDKVSNIDVSGIANKTKEYGKKRTIVLLRSQLKLYKVSSRLHLISILQRLLKVLRLRGL
ncbi:hypothetical protein [Photobacterium leiognathi]|uniref:hypothetical protein n=1 Tax=Photobacterium leiognathi TaxID=553611 RepID=UPI003AF35B81